MQHRLKYLLDPGLLVGLLNEEARNLLSYLSADRGLLAGARGKLQG